MSFHKNKVILCCRSFPDIPSVGQYRDSYQATFSRTIYSTFVQDITPLHPHIQTDENSITTTTERVQKVLLHAWNYMLHLLSSLICWMHEDVTRIRRGTHLFLWLKHFVGSIKYKRTTWSAHIMFKLKDRLMNRQTT